MVAAVAMPVKQIRRWPMKGPHPHLQRELVAEGVQVEQDQATVNLQKVIFHLPFF